MLASRVAEIARLRDAHVGSSKNLKDLQDAAGKYATELRDMEVKLAGKNADIETRDEDIETLRRERDEASTASNAEVARLRLENEEQKRVMQERAEQLVESNESHAESDRELAVSENENAKLRLENAEQRRVLQERGETARAEIAAKDAVLAGRDDQIEGLRLAAGGQARALRDMEKKRAAADDQLAILRAEARPGVEVRYVDEGVTRIEGEGEGEPPAKRVLISLSHTLSR